MRRIAVFAVVVLLTGVLSPLGRAQSPIPPTTQKGFSFCTVHDTAGHTVWASPVFEYEYPTGNAWSRNSEMATDFYNFISSTGGAGDKQCAFGNGDRAVVEAARNEQRSILTQRFMGVVRANKWLDVAWTPKPWTPALMVKPAVISKFFYCYGTDTEQRTTLATSVASPIFEVSMDGTDLMAPYTLAHEYTEEFTRYVVAVHGLTQANPSCLFNDTHAEAEKALRDYRRLFSGFNLKFTDVAWQPTGRSMAPSVAPASTVTPPAIGSTVPSAPVSAPSATPAAPAAVHIAVPNEALTSAAAGSSTPAVGSRKYCHVFIQFVGKPGGVHSRVWENTGSDGSQAAMTATLTAFAEHIRQLQPKTWHAFTPSPAQCDMNIGFCFATAVRHFGTSQIAGQFCKTTREEAEADWARLAELDRAMEIVAWPVAQ